jgi:hypothetical protein
MSGTGTPDWSPSEDSLDLDLDDFRLNSLLNAPFPPFPLVPPTLVLCELP